ncbi:MAG: FecR domain-containing protein [Bacteroides sp.]|nr:FecR domain-containing protein [Bacteroides sp.]
MNHELLTKYFKGETSVEEEKIILDWVEQSEENTERFRKERLIYDVALFTPKTSPAIKKETGYAYLHKWGMRAAAVLLISLLGGYFIKNNLQQPDPAMQTLTVPPGQRAQLSLADGTQVWLNAKSTLTYSLDFSRKERNVTLNGEAYFEVSPDSKRPFIVHTESYLVQVVGTSFNVQAYAGTGEFETTLVEGVVDILKPETRAVVTRLSPNEFFGYYRGQTQKGRHHSYDFLKWREGLYCFDDSPFQCILNRLENYFDVTITVENPALLDYHCTGKFKDQDGLEHILKVISKDHPFTYRYTKNKDTILIR